MAIEHDPEHAEIAALQALVPSFAGRRVLEIGCGDGRLTRRYADTAAAVTAIDPDATAIAECQTAVRAWPHVAVYAVPFEQFVAPPATYDVVILSWSL
jgi:2-polyprenyl-3-methyl-5-hydroxy-6-metoxy-1,4-benzoquinol methylase